jgi:acyl carrier protein
MSVEQEQDHTIRTIICDILEIDNEQLRPDAVFSTDYNADSLRAVEILAALEKQLKLKIPESELPNLQSLAAVKEVLARCGWQG